MKKTDKLPPASLPLPKFSSDQELAAYFENHSVAAIWDRLPQAKPPKLSKSLSKSIREQHAKQSSSIRLDSHCRAKSNQADPSHDNRNP